MPAKIQLTDTQIKEMFEMRSKMKLAYGEIGKKFGVSMQTVQRRVESYVEKNEISKQSIDGLYHFDRHYFDDIDTPDKAYWLGFITADGHLNEDNCSMRIKLGVIDIEHLKKFQKAIHAEEVPITTETHSITNKLVVAITLNGKEISNSLKSQGIKQHKSQHEQVPNIDERFYRDFIRGLWDGDGYISNRKIGLCSSYEMCHWVQKCFNKFCGVPINKVFFDSNIYKIYIVKGQLDVLDWLYYPGCKHIALERKYKAAKLKKLRNMKKVSTKNINDFIAVKSGNTLDN